MAQEIKKDPETDARKHRDEALNQMAFASPLGRLLSSATPGADPLTPALLAARDFAVHPVHRARDIFGNVRDLDVAEYVFEFRGDAVAAGNRLAERDGFANHFQIRAA